MGWYAERGLLTRDMASSMSFGSLLLIRDFLFGRSYTVCVVDALLGLGNFFVIVTRSLLFLGKMCGKCSWLNAFI